MKHLIVFIIIGTILSVGKIHAIEEFKITANDGDREDFFGISVSINGDYAIVGASSDDDNGENSGSAYIFIRDGQEWVQQDKITADDGEDFDVFAMSVSINGDYAIVGAYLDDNDNGENSGSAYIFARDGEHWVQQEKITADDGYEDNYFGNSVSIDSDYAIVGAFRDDVNEDDSGSGFIYSETPIIPRIVLSADTLEFGEVIIDHSESMMLLVSNEGNEDLEVSDISIVGEPFIIDYEDVFVVEPDSSHEVLVTFTPEARDNFEGILTIISDDPENGEISVLLLGIGLADNDVREYYHSLPEFFFLSEAYPNPFNSTATISYGLSTSGNASLEVYNLSGQRITTLFKGFKQAGSYSTTLLANNLSTGLYLIQLKASYQIFTQKVMLIR